MGIDKEKDEMMRRALYTALASCQTAEDVEMLLADLCTFKEVDQMAQRLAAAKMLKAGKTYTEIIAETEISSATLSRVSRCVQRGSGGYEKLV